MLFNKIKVVWFQHVNVLHLFFLSSMVLVLVLDLEPSAGGLVTRGQKGFNSHMTHA